MTEDISSEGSDNDNKLSINSFLNLSGISWLKIINLDSLF